MPFTHEGRGLVRTTALLVCCLALAPGTVLAAPEFGRCDRYGALESISLTDWESGLGAWTTSTRSVTNPATFDTPDWAVAGSLPDARTGRAAFVANLDIGNCATDDETGVLELQSPAIVIPLDAEIPRLSVDHWFQVEDLFNTYWDGGNLKISVNGGSFTLVPASAFESRPYNVDLEPALDDLGIELNTNPLAGQDAFGSTDGGWPTGRWAQSRINLTGIADPGDTIRLRFDFGIDGCGGDVGWYVDEVEVYSCAGELPTSNCGNRVIEAGEQCDDGNDFVGDGCSSLCQVEPGWSCTLPDPDGFIPDASFEEGQPNPFWTNFSTNPLGSPICSQATCGVGGSPSDGDYWLWFGGVQAATMGWVRQTGITIPSTTDSLDFDLRVTGCDSPSDFLEVRIDGNPVESISAAGALCGQPYARYSVNLDGYADDGLHELELYAETFFLNGKITNFWVDRLALPGEASICRREGTSLTLVKKVTNNFNSPFSPLDWTLSATGGPTPFSGPGPELQSPIGFLPGTYDLSESEPSGYSEGAWSCSGGNMVDDDTIIVGEDEYAICEIVSEDIPPTLTVIKTIQNNDGGTNTDPNSFGLRVDGQPALHANAQVVDFGDHSASELGRPGYIPGAWSGDCAPDGSITLGLGENATCTITNDDIAPTLRVQKTIVNDDGGTVADENLFGLRIDGNLVQHDAVNVVSAGTRIVSEDGLPGYVAGSWGGDCAPNGSVELGLAENATCTITNNDSNATKLTLVKQVTNNNGGTANGSEWTLSAIGPDGFSGLGPSLTSGAGLLAGTYDLSESGGAPGYSSSGVWICNGGTQVDGDTVTLAPGEVVTCTISGDDIPPSLALLKEVVNDDSGSFQAADWTLVAIGPIYMSGPGSGVYSGSNFKAGSYNLSESGFPFGYTRSPWSCTGTGNQVDDDTIALDVGESATCTITNNDRPARLTVQKFIVNEYGGTVTDPDAFGLKVDGNPVLHNQEIVINAGLHLVTEDSLAGYEAGPWGGDCSPDGSVDLSLAENATCTITNYDSDETRLILIKDVLNDDGGTAQPSAWTLTATGPVSFGGSGPIVSSGFGLIAGTYVLSESGGVDGYATGDWLCEGGSQDGADSVTLAPGDTATCTIVNDDIAPTLTVQKTIVNNDGGLVENPDLFGLRVDGQPVLHDMPVQVSAGNHTVSEDGLEGYAPGSWGGDCNPDGTITLNPGDNATCTITNDDTAATSLVLVKQVINNHGGTATAADWTLTATGPTGFDGPGPMVTSPEVFQPGTYHLSESSTVWIPGEEYSPGNWQCNGGSMDDADTITLAEGDTVTCAIVNDDIPASLTIDKTVIANDGGSVTDPDAFALKIDGNGVLDEVPNDVAAGLHTVSEVGLPGYVASDWGGDCAPDGSITLALGQVATCTITNDDAPASLTLELEVRNDSGGTAAPSAWTLNASGLSAFFGPGPTASSTPVFQPGTYDLSLSGGAAGYAAGDWDCVGGVQDDPDSVTVALGQAVSCSIVVDDIAPTIIVLKSIVNDNGGSIANPNEFGLRIDGALVTHGVANTVDAGAHVVSEDGQADYVAGDWGGDCNTDGTITVALGNTATCTVVNDDAAPGLTLQKQLINNNGGTALHSDWTLTATGPSGFSGAGPSVSNGPGFKPGTYDLSESTGPTGYTKSAWVCIGGTQTDADTVVLDFGETAVCTITNDDIPPSLTLVKQVLNNDGGDALASAWTLHAAGPTPFSGAGPTQSSNAGFDAGSYDLSESGGPAGYAAGDWDCVGVNQDDADTITLGLGQSATCTLVNDDIQPTLTVQNTIVNDNGGTVGNPDAFNLKIDGVLVSNGVANPFDAGPHTVSQDGLPGYQAGSWGGACTADGSVTLQPGQNAVCTISNDDKEPALTLVKNVINNNGGDAVASDWTLTATGPDGFSGSGPSVSNQPGFQTGAYVLSESGGPTGYSPSTWSCTGGGVKSANTITLSLGDSATCTITNNDIPPTLRVVKTVVNDNGGTVTNPNAFGLRIDGALVTSGAIHVVDEGMHTVSEDGLAGYAAGTWGGACAPEGTVSLALDEDAVCTLTNDDIAPSLTLVKEVVNDDGGSAVESDWTLHADGPTPFSGAGPSVSNGLSFDAGTYLLSESGGPGGYLAGDWDCIGGTQLDADSVSVALGDEVTCTLVNDDLGAGLTLVKEVVNNHGGTANPSQWTLTATGPGGFSGPGPTVSGGENFVPGTYDLSENDGPDGYAESDWVCVGVTQDDADTVTLELGQSATCTIVNDDIQPTLTVQNTVVNDNGGSSGPDAFNLKIDGGLVSDGVANPVNAGLRTVSQDALAGYQAGNWGGDCAPDGSIDLLPGQNAVCTITNDDIEPSLTLVKEVLNDNSGAALASDWTLHADGPTPFSGAGPSVSNGLSFDAGTYLLSESGGPGGYLAGDWDCIGGTQLDADSVSVALGDEVTCTLVNDDLGAGLTLVKEVVNNHGGTASPSQWTLTAQAQDSVISGPGPIVSSGENFEPGTYDLSESGGPEGYAPSAWVCVGVTQDDADTVTLELGESATCTIVNDDIQPTLTVQNTVVNDNGGSSGPDAFNLKIDGGLVADGVANPVNAGLRTVSQDALAGYQAGNWGGDCAPDGSIDLLPGQNAVCTITNDDIEPSLTLVKEVINDDGGAELASAWTLHANGPTPFSGTGPSVSSGLSFEAGSYDLSESGGPAGYTASEWLCEGTSQDDADTITLALGETATCTITNDDDATGQIFSDGFESN